MEGVKDIIEPYMVLWLAWALGAAIQVSGMDGSTVHLLVRVLTQFCINIVRVS